MLRKKLVGFMLAAVLAFMAVPAVSVQAAELELKLMDGTSYARYSYPDDSGRRFFQSTRYGVDGEKIPLTETDRIVSILRDEMGVLSSDNVMLIFDWSDDAADIRRADGKIDKDVYIVSMCSWKNGYIYGLNTGNSGFFPILLYTEDYKTADILPFGSVGTNLLEGKDLYLGYDYISYEMFLSYDAINWYESKDGTLVDYLTNSDNSKEYISESDADGNLNYYEYLGNQQWKEVDESFDTEGLISDPYWVGPRPDQVIDSLKINGATGTAAPTAPTAPAPTAPAPTAPAPTAPAPTAPAPTAPAPTAPKAPAVPNANPTASKVYINDNEVSFNAYNINDNNYFKLRDVAFILSGTEKQFDIAWNNDTKSAILLQGTEYTVAGGEMAAGDAKAKNATPSTVKVLLNGKELKLTAYSIGGSNYFKLAELAKELNFSAEWDGANQAIKVSTAKSFSGK